MWKTTSGLIFTLILSSSRYFLPITQAVFFVSWGVCKIRPLIINNVATRLDFSAQNTPKCVRVIGSLQRSQDLLAGFQGAAPRQVSGRKGRERCKGKGMGAFPTSFLQFNHCLTLLNFQVDWFSTFWYTLTFMFQHFDLNLPILGQNLTF